ncbi:hypothetical protein GALMADRAFT_242775 [Galerina marginata CBS 339.88]|uniref:S5 DRBM domain-containing protein n=1 Tax=Galerina marginata (strain CBS 339.88) TaxID=685588 RepID=A0A067TAZ5_GALM3|nr:hypothetical protein GALMADRAFT_242775 [Galerina marginata CBS 339.88]
MNRLLFLRPVSRAIRVQGSSTCSRNLSRAFATTPCQNFGATGSVNKKKNKDMSSIDAELFGGEVERTTQLEPEAPVKSTRKAPIIPKEDGPAIEKEPEPQYHLLSLEPEEPSSQDLLPPPPLQKLDLDQFYSSWFSAETRFFLAEQRIDRYAFVSGILQTPPGLEALGKLDATAEDEFDKRWIAFEMEEGDEDKALIPVLEFFLKNGLQLLAPTPDTPHPEQCVLEIDPTVARKALDSQGKGRWQLMASEVMTTTSKPIPYPDLMTPDSLLDPRDVLELPPTLENPFHNRVIVRNHRSVFHQYPEGEDLLEDEPPLPDAQQEGDSMSNALPVPLKYYQNLYHSILMRRAVVQQTGKGKIRRVAFMVLVGDGNGLVGYGEGKHSNGAVALKAARLAAVKNMDWVERFEKRTIWTEMSSKLGATQLIIRPRPVGFGLRCNPFLHQILRAAGLKDISAKVWGSRNKLNVIKAAFRMLHAGHAPTGMGDGLGGKGKKLSKGAGVRGKSELERARGRKLINLRN